MKLNTYYKKRNTYNIKIAQRELSVLACEPIIASEVNSHFTPFKSNANIVYSSIKTHSTNRKWSKQVASTLFKNTSEFLQNSIGAYYITVDPINSYLSRDKYNRPTFRTLGNVNPVKANTRAYNEIKAEFTRNNRRKNTTKYLIIIQHQEHGKPTNKLTDNNHDNYLILTSRKLSKIKLNKLIKHIINIYANYNNISSNNINSYHKIINSADINSINAHIAYVDENSSSLPYCKHTSKGQSQLNDLNNTPDTALRQYLVGLMNTSKGVQQLHKCRTSSLKKFIKKANKQAKLGHRPKIKLTTREDTKNSSNGNFEPNEPKLNDIIKDLIPKTKFAKYVEYDKSTIIQYLELKCGANYGCDSASDSKLRLSEMYMHNHNINYDLLFFLSVVEQLRLFSHKPT